MKPTIRTLFTSILTLATLPALGQSAPSAPPAATAPDHTFTIQGDHFTLHAKPFKILSGELHYARIPIDTNASPNQE